MKIYSCDGSYIHAYLESGNWSYTIKYFQLRRSWICTVENMASFKSYFEVNARYVRQLKYKKIAKQIQKRIDECAITGTEKLPENVKKEMSDIIIKMIQISQCHIHGI